MMQTRADEKNLVLKSVIPKELPPLKADRDKIKQVVLNLLSNAIEYNRPTGEVTLSAAAEAKEIKLVVSDTGPGIQETDLAHLFEKFYRAHATEKVTQGTGLGLAICKRIIEAHGGTIEVHSQIGLGTTFIVHIPLKAS
jgi:two-component system phosphate regulon sensor histidine kinase PhoR